MMPNLRNARMKGVNNVVQFSNLDLSNVEFSSGSSVIPVGDHVATVTGAERLSLQLVQHKSKSQ